MVKNHWSNLNIDGRRLEKIIKICETNIKNTNHGDDLVLAYMDRLIKATNQKSHIADLVLGISHLRKLAEKRLDQPKVYLGQ